MLGLFLLIAVFLLARRWWVRDSRLHLVPPGPPADPVIGHTRILPRRNSEIVFTQWAKQYGDIVYLRVPGKSIVILNTTQAAADLLEKRSGKYSSRPGFSGYELFGFGELLSFLPYDERFHKQRKYFQQAFTRQGSSIYQPLQLAGAHTLLKSLLRSPDGFIEHVRLFITAIIMEITYAHTVTSENDPYVQSVEEITAIFVELGNNQLLSYFRFLRYLPAWFPGAWFIRLGKSVRPLVKRLHDEPFERVQRQMAAGAVKPCFVSLQLEELERQGGYSEADISDLKTAAFQMYGAATETTWSTLMNCIAAMLLYPEVQAKAHVELASVLGDRLPDFADRSSLPYLESVLHEVTRWRPTVPLGLPHASIADDMYRGMFIPKGSIVIANATAMSQDENVYKDPHLFKPERFLPPNSEQLPTDFTFGFGRRICPGRHLAEDSVWLVVASILTAFEIMPATDEDGKAVIPDMKFTSAITSHPEPFACAFRPRSKRVMDMIEQL